MACFELHELLYYTSFVGNAPHLYIPHKQSDLAVTADLSNPEKLWLTSNCSSLDSHWPELGHTIDVERRFQTKLWGVIRHFP